MIRRRVTVRGSVQGVFFRDSCRQEASRCGVTGWVTNRDDGAVEAVFEGSVETVGEMVDWAHEGPHLAVVESVDVTEEEPQGEAGFSVR